MQNLKLQFKIKNIRLNYLIYIILILLPLYLVKFNIINIPLTVLEIIIYISFIFFIIKSFLDKKIKEHILRFIKNPFFIFWLLFLVSGVIAIYVSPEKKVALGVFKAYFFDSSLFLLLFISSIKTKDELMNCFKVLFASGFILALIGLAQYLFLPQYLQEGRIKGLFSSPNYLSLYITPISFLILGLFKKFNKSNRYKNIILLFLYFIIILTITLTFSRGAWLGLILGLIFFFGILILNKFKLLKLKIFFVSIFLLGFLASFWFVTKGSYSYNLVSQNRVYTSDNIRKEIWSTSLDIGSKNWLLGIGLGNFQNYFSQYTKNRINYPEYITPHAITPHNIFLNIWLQVGLLGLLGILGLIGIFFVKCFRGLKKEFLFNTILIATMVSILGQGLVDSAIWKNDLIIVFWFLIGSSYIINTKGKKDGK